MFAPFTWVSYPAASWLWLGVQLLVVGWCSVALAEIAGLRGRRDRVLAFGAVVTFGPVVLNLTLGQNGLVLLLAALCLGLAMRRESPTHTVAAGAAWVVAILGKLYPAVWLGAAVLTRRWRLVAVALSLSLVTLGGVLAGAGPREREWLDQLPDDLRSHSEASLADDQSLNAWMDRLTRPRRFTFGIRSPSEPRRVESRAVVEIDRGVVAVVTGVFLAAVLGGILHATLRYGSADPEAVLYLWVLFGLIAVPHAERYQQVLLLPGVAWCWRRGSDGRLVGAGAYFLAGLARLNHVWVAFLPSPWNVLASGFGLWAAILLALAVALGLRAASRELARVHS
jgi:hypothetical protein